MCLQLSRMSMRELRTQLELQGLDSGGFKDTQELRMGMHMAATSKADTVGSGYMGTLKPYVLMGEWV
jgi:hypothetical protein